MTDHGASSHSFDDVFTTQPTLFNENYGNIEAYYWPYLDAIAVRHYNTKYWRTYRLTAKTREYVANSTGLPDWEEIGKPEAKDFIFEGMMPFTPLLVGKFMFAY